MHVLLINVLWSNISDTIFFIIVNMVYIVIKPTSFYPAISLISFLQSSKKIYNFYYAQITTNHEPIMGKKQ